MRILDFQSTAIYPFTSGGRLDLLHLFRRLSLKGCDCHSLCLVKSSDLQNQADAYKKIGVIGKIAANSACLNFKIFKTTLHLVCADKQAGDEGSIIRKIRTIKPDFLLISVKDYFALELAEKLQLRTVAFCNDFLYPRPNQLSKAYQKRIRRIDRIYVKSRFMQNAFENDWGLPARILRPQFSPKPVLLKSRRKFIVAVNPIPEKGGRLFFRLAKAFPEQPFLAVNGWHDFRPRIPKALWNAKNVAIIEPVENLAPIFSQARAFLMPSQLPEGAGRVVVEAQAQSTPAISSSNGGLSEMLLGGGAVAPAPIWRGNGAVPGVRMKPWIDQLESLLASRQKWEAASQNALRAANDYFESMDASLNEFIDDLKSM